MHALSQDRYEGILWHIASQKKFQDGLPLESGTKKLAFYIWKTIINNVCIWVLLKIGKPWETPFHYLVSLLTWWPILNDLGVPHFRNHHFLKKTRHGHPKDPKVYQLPRWNEWIDWNDHKKASPETNFGTFGVFHLPRAQRSRFGCHGADANVQAQNPKSHPAHPAGGVGIFLSLALIPPKLLALGGKLWNHTKSVNGLKYGEMARWNWWKCMRCRRRRKRRRRRERIVILVPAVPHKAAAEVSQ